jgi:hypothetical protein
MSPGSYSLALGAMALLEFFAATAVTRIVAPQLGCLAPERRLHVIMIVLAIVVMIVLTIGTVHMLLRRNGRSGFGL